MCHNEVAPQAKEGIMRMKLSIIIPVYCNEDTLIPLFNDLKEKALDAVDYEYEIVMVDDGSTDNSWAVMERLCEQDDSIVSLHLSKNFGSHAAILCGLENCSGDCAVVKAADLQEPSELILQMVNKWKAGDNVVLAVRSEREEGKSKAAFANMYYWLTRKVALPNMPKKGFDVYLVDRKVIDVLSSLDNTNSALTGQILWSGFKTGIVEYTRKAREIGTSKWTFAKKLRLVADTLFSFSTTPIKAVELVGAIAFFGALIWAIVVFILRVSGAIDVDGWTSLFIFSLFSFGMIMVTLGILGEYLWRVYDSSRGRPSYIVETKSSKHGDEQR